MPIGAALAAATVDLRAHGIASPRLDAELLLGHILHKSRTRLAIESNQPISPEELTAFRELLELRRIGRPVAYLIGHREFLGHDFVVGPGVLVPRPETELLVEHAMEMIDRLWPDRAVRVLDLCTGSGAIACSLALSTDPARVHITASDISVEALAYARINARNLGLENRVTLVRGDLLTWTRGPWDLIVSNPPYLRPDQIDGNQEIAAEPRLALDGGNQGIEIIASILEQTPGIVSNRFGMLIELDPDHASLARDLAMRHLPDAHSSIRTDLAGRDRYLVIDRL